MGLIHNERLKLFATYLNGLAIAVFVVGGLAPSFSLIYGTLPPTMTEFVAIVSASCLVASSALHWLGSMALKRLRS